MSEGVHIVCAHCDAVNRVPPEKNAAGATCGRGQRRLFDGHPENVGDAGLIKQIERSDIPVVVDFWAEWCGPCRMMATGYAAAASELEPRIRFLKVDVDQHKQAAAKFGVQGIPALFVFRKGEIVAQQAGAMNAAALKSWIVNATRAV